MSEEAKANETGRGVVRTIDSAKEMKQLTLEGRFFDEVHVSGFTHLDHEIGFFTQASALLRKEDVVLDFGAGRGEFMYNDPSNFRRDLQNFKGRCAHVDGCDVDPAVLQNETLDTAKVLTPGEALPYADDRFDRVVSRWVFEHLDDPEWAARELLRVTKPGGWICAITPNKWGYVSLAARVVPNKLHAAILKLVQPHRKEQDVFPTVYKLNTKAALKKYFGDHATIHTYTTSSVPAYHFGRPILFRGFSVLHRLLPPALNTLICIFIQKQR